LAQIQSLTYLEGWSGFDGMTFFLNSDFNGGTLLGIQEEWGFDTYDYFFDSVGNLAPGIRK